MNRLITLFLLALLVVVPSFGQTGFIANSRANATVITEQPEEDVPSLNSPYSYKLKQFAKNLYNPSGQRNLYVIGDSINSTNTLNKMHVGYRNNFRIQWNGWFVHADSGAADNGFTNGQNATVNEIRIPGDTYTNGFTDVSPFRTRDLFYGDPIGNGWTLSDGAFLPASLSSFRLGNPFSGLTSVSLVYLDCSTSLSSFNVIGTVNLSGVSSHTVTTFGTNQIVLDSPVSFNTFGGFPGIRVSANSTTPYSIGRQLVILGSIYKNSNVNGVTFIPIAHGGWKIPDHLSLYSDATLIDTFDAIGYPTEIIIWLGQNQSPAESTALSAGDYSVIKADYQSLINKYTNIVLSQRGYKPNILLVSQYQTGYYPATHKLIARAQYELAQINENVSSLNVYRLAGDENFDITTYTSDGVHPNLSGTNFITNLMDLEMYSSVYDSKYKVRY